MSIEITKNKGYTIPDYSVVKTHDAVTADVAEGDADIIDITGAKSVMIVFTEGGTVNNRSADLTLQVSADGSTFVDYNMLIDNVTNTNSQDLTRIASKTRAAAGTDILFMSPETLGSIQFIRLPLDVTDGASPTGNFTVSVAICR